MERRIDLRCRCHGHLQRPFVSGAANAYRLCGRGLDAVQFADVVARSRRDRRYAVTRAVSDAVTRACSVTRTNTHTRTITSAVSDARTITDAIGRGMLRRVVRDSGV